MIRRFNPRLVRIIPVFEQKDWIFQDLRCFSGLKLARINSQGTKVARKIIISNHLLIMLNLLVISARLEKIRQIIMIFRF